MKRILSVGSVGIVLSLSLAACNSSNSADPGNNAAAQQAANTPAPSIKLYPVSESDRNNAVDSLKTQSDQVKTLESQILAPAIEDQSAYPSYVNQPDRGLIRLMAGQNELPTIPYNGTSYGVVRGYEGRDLVYDGEKFQSELAGVDYGFFADLGGVDLDSLTIDSPGVRFAAQYHPVSNSSPCEGNSGSARMEQNRVTDSDVFAKSEGYNYSREITATVGSAYVLRALSYDESDSLIVFKVVRQDPKDQSLIIIWKKLQSNAVPSCVSAD